MRILTEPAVHSDADLHPDPASQMAWVHADPDPQHCKEQGGSAGGGGGGGGGK